MRNQATRHFLVLACGLTSVACAPGEETPRDVDVNGATSLAVLSVEDGGDLPEGDIFTVQMGRDGPVAARVDSGLVEYAFSGVDYQKDAEAPPPPAPPPPKTDARVARSGSVELIVQLHDEYRLRRMEHLGPDETRESAGWASKSARNDGRVAEATAARQAAQASFSARWRARGAAVHSDFWLINAVHITVDASQLPALELDAAVSGIHPAAGGGVATTVLDGRNVANTDHFYSMPGLSGGFVAVVDSGVRASHQLLAGRSSWVRDCVNGVTNSCGTAGSGLTLDPSDFSDHGTGVASLLSGGSAWGNAYRGVTGIYFDSFRVVDAGGVIYAAFIRAMQAAVTGGSDVTNVSLDCGSTVCSDAANAAFDAGMLVVSASANTGEGGAYVGTPAAGKRVFAVGAIDASTYARLPYSSYGPPPSNVTKPDAMGVSGSYAVGLTMASRASDTASLDAWGTSVASPIVAGGAALLSRWMKAAFTAPLRTPPGQITAMLLGLGVSSSFSPATDMYQGSGRLVMPTFAMLSSGKVAISGSQTIDVPVTLSSTGTLDGAIFWGEGATHNDVDLRLISPTGVVHSTSLGTPGVWEKVRVSTSQTGTWKLRLTGYSVPGGTQDVYWAAIVR